MLASRVCAAAVAREHLAEAEAQKSISRCLVCPVGEHWTRAYAWQVSLVPLYFLCFSDAQGQKAEKEERVRA